MEGGTTPTAGWYPDAGIGGLRWWDGEKWTEHTHVTEPAAVAQPAASAQPSAAAQPPAGVAAPEASAQPPFDPASINPADFAEPFHAPDSSRLRTIVIIGALGLLAAIAGAFLLTSSLGDDAQDTAGGGQTEEETQTNLRAAQTAIETYSTDNSGSYAGATPEVLSEIEPVLDEAALEVSATDTGYTLTQLNPSTGTSFVVIRDGTSGAVTLSCNQPGQGACAADGTWGQ